MAANSFAMARMAACLAISVFGVIGVCVFADPIASQTEIDNSMGPRILQAQDLIKAKKAEEAIRDHLDPGIAHFEQYRKENVRVYPARGLAEVLASRNTSSMVLFATLPDSSSLMPTQ